MKREIVVETDIDEFANERGQDDAPAGDPVPLRWIGGVELSQIRPRSKEMVVDKILPAGSADAECIEAEDRENHADD
jgi:hypothetical protein